MRGDFSPDNRGCNFQSRFKDVVVIFCSFPDYLFLSLCLIYLWYDDNQMTPLIHTLIISILLYLPSPVPVETPAVSGDTTEVIIVEVEGVGSSQYSAPVAALREIGERARGRSFSIVYGKHIAFGEEVLSPTLDTSRKKVLSIEEIKTGLYKAVMEVEVPVGSRVLDDILRERVHRGEGELQSGGGLLSARDQARDEAMGEAIMATVAERYPGNSAPDRLNGRVFFLGTIREDIEEENYVILARIKVWLVAP